MIRLFTLGSFLPPPKSTMGAEVDQLFLFIFYMSVVFFVLVTGGIMALVWRYRRRGEPKLTTGAAHNTPLEILWSVIPGILVLIIFFWGFRVYMRLTVAPSNATEIRVTAKQWSWLFTYPEGARSPQLVVPKGRPVKLIMSSEDVIHSLFIPDFRVKMDVLPYRYTSLWFEAVEEGEFDVYCTEYCGDQHSQMNTTVLVKSEEEYREWLKENSKPPTGKELYTIQGCASCHSVDGTPGIGPTMKGLYGKTENLVDGSTVEVNDNYLRESILEPQAKVVTGYQPVMPRMSSLTEADVNGLIDYIKSLEN